MSDAREDIAHEKDLPDANCISKCHQEKKQTKPGLSPLYYPDSVHGKAYLDSGIQDAAKCWDCHGKHNIKSPSDSNSRVNRKNISLICSVCHGNHDIIFKYHTRCKKSSQEYMEGVHGRALYKSGLVLFAAVCRDCHGIHNIKGVRESQFFAKQPENCGKCHILVFNKYKESTHGRKALEGNKDVPFCVDCHGEHKIISPGDEGAPTSWKNVSNTCCTCHAHPKIMKRFDIYNEQIEYFIQSSHEITLGNDNKSEINCTSCHGFHDIRPADDLHSRINPANLTKTCGQENCHPGMLDNIDESKIHTNHNKKKSGAFYYISPIVFWIISVTLLSLIFGVAIITIHWLLPRFIRKIKYKKK